MLFMGETATIGLYGFLKNFCPDGFYMSNILLGPGKNLTIVETTQDVYPMSVYSNLILTLVALLVTDILQYKTIIIVGAMASVLTKAFLYWGTTVLHIQIMQLMFGVYRASQVAYRTYIYTKVDKHQYQSVTAVVHITPKVGTLVSAVVAQLLLSAHLVSMQNLIEMSFVGLLAALVTAMLLPSVEGTAYCADPAYDSKTGRVPRYRHAAKLLWEELKLASTNLNVVKWCVWWVLANAIFPMVTDCYVQVLWNEISGEKQTIYNAGVEAIYACFSSVVCYLTGRIHINWHVHGDAVFAVFTLVKAAGLLACAYTSSMLVSYCLYIGVSTLYDMMMVISNSQVALQMKNDGFGLIFGINTFLALVFQSAFTYIFTAKKTLALSIRQQFVAVGCSFVVLGLACSVQAAYTVFVYQQDLKPQKPVEVVSSKPTVVAVNGDCKD